MLERLNFESVLKSTLSYSTELHTLTTRSMRLPSHVIHYGFCIGFNWRPLEGRVLNSKKIRQRFDIVGLLTGRISDMQTSHTSNFQRFFVVRLIIIDPA